MTTLFISDLHLEEKRPDIIEAFFDFLNTKACKAESLYILGDFFEAWIGDDENTPLQVSIKDALKKLTNSETQLFIMHGNRDFLMGQLFCEETGATLLSDPAIINLYGENVLLMHGDSLCSHDVEYIKFRKSMRNEEWQSMFLKRTLAERQLVAQQLRTISQAKNKGKTLEIMDVKPEDVVQAIKTANVATLIHGHTHRPAVHELEIEGKTCKRMVLGDWDKSVWYIEASSSGVPTLHHYPLGL